VTRALPALVLVAVVGCDATGMTVDHGAWPPALEGECHMASQRGCDPGQRCRLRWTYGDSCSATETCEDLEDTDHFLGVGSECADESSTSICRPGTACSGWWDVPHSYYCYRVCLSDEDCLDPGSECSMPFTMPPLVERGDCWPEGIDASPYRLCTLP
jgi:hypothetical protein